MGFPSSSVGKESTWNAGDSCSIPGSGRSTGEGIGYKLQYSWASLVAQLVKNPPAMRETWVGTSGLENSMDCISQTQLSDFHFHFSLQEEDQSDKTVILSSSSVEPLIFPLGSVLEKQHLWYELLRLYR